jgi:nucleotide sugar dehydrogenase
VKRSCINVLTQQTIKATSCHSAIDIVAEQTTKTQAPSYVVGGHFDYDIAIVGLGYVGLPTALALHRNGRRVLGLDVSRTRLADIRAQRADLLPSDRKSLNDALAEPEALVLASDPSRVREARVVLVCVPTPIDLHQLPDLEPLRAACRSLVDHAVPGQTLILSSTTYVGCTRDFLVEPLRQRGLEPGRDVFVSFAPERIDPGNEGHIQTQVPRVVGGVSPRCLQLAADALQHCASQVHAVSSVEAAEMTKLYENTFRAVNISLANEMADISGMLGLNITEVIEAAATKPYGFMPFRPGPGIGGHCIPCDPHYLLWQLRQERLRAPLIETAMTAIAHRPLQVVQRIVAELAERGRPLSDARILIFGIAYKPDVADVRESPAEEIISRLSRAGTHVAFADDLVDSLVVDGKQLRAVTDPDATTWDLVVVHTLHTATETSWLAAQPVVLDASYRLDPAPNVHLL